MKSYLFLIAALLLSCGNALGQSSSPDQAIDAWFTTHSFTDSKHPLEKDYLALFTDTASLVMVVSDALVTITAAEYVEQWVRYVSQFSKHVETELSRQTESYGNVAQVVSSYVVESEGKQMGRGVYFFRLLQLNKEWKIHSLGGQLSSESLPLPPRFLDDQ